MVAVPMPLPLQSRTTDRSTPTPYQQGEGDALVRVELQVPNDKVDYPTTNVTSLKLSDLSLHNQAQSLPHQYQQMLPLLGMGLKLPPHEHRLVKKLRL